MTKSKFKTCLGMLLASLFCLFAIDVYAEDGNITGTLIGEPNMGYVEFSDGADGWCLEEDK